MDLVEMGRRVKQRRQALGLDQEDMAEKIGRTRGYVSRLEAGKSGESLRDLIAVAKVLGMKLSELVGETDEALLAEVRRRLPDGSEIVVSFERIARALPNQTEAEKEFIRRTMEAFADRLAPRESETVDDT